MVRKLKEREAQNRPLQVGVIGAGSMGRAIVRQIARTPGMRIAFVADERIASAIAAVRLAGGQPVEDDHGAGALPRGGIRVTTEPVRLLQNLELPLDTVVEATNSIGPAAEYCLAAIRRPCHVVLMNAEVDLAFGPLLQHEAAQNKVVVTSDAGDQHGVLATMIEEIQLWGFEIVQAGNIKGFLDRNATPDSIRDEAAKRNLNPVQCCAYTDGTKLNIEMALVSNGTGLTPSIPGMEGPPCKNVHDALHAFDFLSYNGKGHVDYVLGAEPGGGVYVVGHSDDPLQHDYLEYYKMGAGPYYLFYRPYHLCHLETVRAIGKACLYHEPVLTPACGRVSDVYAYAKRDLPTGHAVTQAIGGPDFYGMIRIAKEADPVGHVPIALLEAEDEAAPVLTHEIFRGEPVRFSGVSFTESPLLRLFERQQALLQQPCPTPNYQATAPQPI